MPLPLLLMLNLLTSLLLLLLPLTLASSLLMRLMRTCRRPPLIATKTNVADSRWRDLTLTQCGDGDADYDRMLQVG